MKIPVFFKGKRILADVQKAGFFRRGLGLMFRTRNTKNLLFEFSRPAAFEGTLTSLFVFFPFLALWLDDKNKVIDFRVVKPFEISIKQKKKFFRIVEIPFNLQNRKVIEKFMGRKKPLLHFRG